MEARHGWEIWEFSKVRGRNMDPNSSRGLIARTPTQRTPVYGNSHLGSLGRFFFPGGTSPWFQHFYSAVGGLGLKWILPEPREP